MTNKIIIAVVLVFAAAACQTETSERVFQLEASDAIADALCQRYVDCAFDGAGSRYYDQCVHWTKIAICGDTGCTDDSVTYAADDVDACIAALSAQECRASVNGDGTPTACDSWNLRLAR
jgi:hypothetical protein